MNLLNSFKSKVAIVLSVFVLVFSSVFFYVYSQVIKEKFYEESRVNIEAALSLLEEQYIYSIKNDKGDVPY